MKKTSVVSFKVTEEKRKELQKIADKFEISVSALIKLALAEFIEKSK